MRVLESNALQSPTPCTFRQLVNGMKETSGEMETNQNSNIPYILRSILPGTPLCNPANKFASGRLSLHRAKVLSIRGDTSVYIEWKDGDSCTEIPERPMCTTLNIRESNRRGSKILVGIFSGQLNNGQWPIYGLLVVDLPR
jgi:hypothetical protein